MRRQRFVLDTSAFTNVGKSKEEINKNIKALINMLAKARQFNISCYTPPSIWKELKGMLERKGISAGMIDKLDAWLIQKSPARIELKVPAEFLYEYVSEIRERFNKGLHAAERAVISAAEGQKKRDFWIGKLRNKYKTEIRQGLVDSIEDLDLLMLAKELDSAIVSKDFGVMNWAKKWGIRFIDADSFYKLLKMYARK